MMQHTMVCIDVRERDLLAVVETEKKPFESASLELGDIQITNASINERLIFERKTCADIAASIKDGRFREQKQRLFSHSPTHRITYLIEGVPSYHDLSNRKTPLYGLPPSTFISALLSLQYRDGCHVILTKNIQDTATVLYEIANRLDTHPDKIQYSQTEKTETSYMESVAVKSRKIENITPESCYVLQLAQVPGFSVKLAQIIVAEYPRLKLLLDALQEKGVKACTSLSGIGAKKAQALVDYLL